MNSTIPTLLHTHLSDLFDLMKDMKENKDLVYEKLGNILNNFSNEYLGIFMNGDFYDYLIDIIDETNVDINKSFNGSNLLHYVIQRRRFDIARQLLDMGALIMNETGFITGNGDGNIFTYDPSNLGVYIPLQKHQVDVYDFVTSYYNKGLMSELDITTGKISRELHTSTSNLVWETDEDFDMCKEKAMNHAKGLMRYMQSNTSGKYDRYAKCKERNAMVEITNLMSLYKFNWNEIFV